MKNRILAALLSLLVVFSFGAVQAFAQTTGSTVQFQLPLAGGSYIDPATGNQVFRLTDRSLCPAGAHHVYSDTFEHSAFGTIVNCRTDRTNTNIHVFKLIGPDHKTVLFPNITGAAKAATVSSNYQNLQWIPGQKRILGIRQNVVYEFDPWNGVTKVYVTLPYACRYDWRVAPNGNITARSGDKLTSCTFNASAGTVASKNVGVLATGADQPSMLLDGRPLFTWNKNPHRAWSPDYSGEIIFDDFHGHLGQFKDSSGLIYTVDTKEDKLASGGVGQVGCPGIPWRPEAGIYNAQTGKRVLIWGCDQPAGNAQWDRDHYSTSQAVNAFSSSGHVSIALWVVDWSAGKVSRRELAQVYEKQMGYWGSARATSDLDFTSILFTSGMCNGIPLEVGGLPKACAAGILDLDLYLVDTKPPIVPAPASVLVPIPGNTPCPVTVDSVITDKDGSTYRVSTKAC